MSGKRRLVIIVTGVSLLLGAFGATTASASSSSPSFANPVATIQNPAPCSITVAGDLSGVRGSGYFLNLGLSKSTGESWLTAGVVANKATTFSISITALLPEGTYTSVEVRLINHRGIVVDSWTSPDSFICTT